MKRVQVDFSGAAREITQEKSIALDLQDRATYRDIVQILAEHYPGLVGTLISDDHQALLSANLFNRNGEEPVMPEEMDLAPRDRERIVILYFIVGG